MTTMALGIVGYRAHGAKQPPVPLNRHCRSADRRLGTVYMADTTGRVPISIKCPAKVFSVGGNADPSGMIQEHDAFDVVLEREVADSLIKKMRLSRKH